MHNIKVISYDNKEMTLAEWQEFYGLEIGSKKIAKYFSYTEYIFAKDLKRYGELVVNAPLMILIDAYREISGRPCFIAAFNRDEAKQQELRDRGYKAATYSPHVWKMAADIDLSDEAEVRQAVLDMRKASEVTGIPCRIGWKSYLPEQTFIHVDVCPLYFAPGAIRHDEFHPVQWEKPSEW